MDKLAREWKKRFETVWDPEGQGKYRMGSPGQRMIKYFIQHHRDGQSVNEYGSGTGRAVMALLDQRPGTKINMVDIAENAMEDPCRKALEENPNLTFTWLRSGSCRRISPSADWGLCIEVLCFVPPEKLDACLREIRRTCRICSSRWPRLAGSKMRLRPDHDHHGRVPGARSSWSSGGSWIRSRTRRRQGGICLYAGER